MPRFAILFLGLLMLIGIVVGERYNTCRIADFDENHFNLTTTPPYAATFWCRNGNEAKMRCSRLYMDRCVSNFNGELMARQKSDETNKDIPDLNRSCDCYIKAYQWELTCNCAVGGGMQHQLRRRTTIRLDSMGEDSVVNVDGIPMRRGHGPCQGIEIDEQICKDGRYMQ